jgi:hypothetical protein
MAGNTLSINGNVTFVAGMTITGTTAARLVINATSTLTSNGKFFPGGLNFSSAGQTQTFADTWTIGGNLAIGNINHLNGGILNVQGSVNLNSTVDGTITIVMTGTGTLTGINANTYIGCNLTFNTAGTITLNASMSIRGAIITYTAGTIVTTGNTLTIGASSTLNTVGMTWNNVTLNATETVTLNSLLSIAGTLTINSGFIITFAGTAGFTTNDFTILKSTALTHILESGITYTVTGNFTSNSSPKTGHTGLKSSIPGTRAIFTVLNGAVVNVAYTDATDIDSSLGRAIFSFGGVFSNTLNWVSITDIVSIVHTFVD